MDHRNHLYVDMRMAKKHLRNAQRQNQALSRKQHCEKILEADGTDKKMFYRLIASQRKSGQGTTDHLVVNDRVYTNSDEVREGWADYFEALATPVDDKRFDKSFKTQVELENLLLRSIYKTEPETRPSMIISTEDVETTIQSMRNGKAADQAGIAAEHLKYGGQAIIILITQLLRQIFTQHLCSYSLQNRRSRPFTQKEWKTQERSKRLPRDSHI